MIKRLFIESVELDENDLSRTQRRVYRILTNKGIEMVDEVFDKIQPFAWHNAAEAWESVKATDEIYADSSLTPLNGYSSYTGAPVVMDVMMGKTIAENISGKKLFLMRTYEDIDWDMIDLSLIEQAFEKNELFILSDDHSDFIRVDPEQIIEDFKP